MKYEAKLRLSKNQYLAVLDTALVIVTEDDNGNPVKWAIFGKGEEGAGAADQLAVPEEVKSLVRISNQDTQSEVRE